MKKLLITIFPLLTYQHIYQLEGYSPLRFMNWFISHPLSRHTSSKKPLSITPRVRSSLLISVFCLLLLLLLTVFFPILLPFTILIILFPFPLLFLATFIRYIPDELIDRPLKVKFTRQLVDSLPHLAIIGITGSFGKTSTKDFLFEILNRHKPTVKTPQSFNTVLSIAKVIKLELLSKTRFFICEMAAYKRGEIKELTQEVNPKFAILTAIGSQHLERFKNLKNTTLAKFELIDAVPPENALVNLDNDLIKPRLSLPQYHHLNTYSLLDPRATFFVKKYQLTPGGINFALIYQQKAFSFTTSLFGTSNLQNLTAAIGMALLLKIPYLTIKTAVSSLTPSPHRLELKKINQATLIDNAYSSNQEGLTQLLIDLKKLPGKKVLITPGIVELGKDAAATHHSLGELAGPVFQQVFLEGHSLRTQNLETGLRESLKPPKISYLDSTDSLWPTINKLSQKYDWILLENDLPDNY